MSTSNYEPKTCRYWISPRDQERDAMDGVDARSSRLMQVHPCASQITAIGTKLKLIIEEAGLKGSKQNCFCIDALECGDMDHSSYRGKGKDV
ncbi:hypothetical protein LguiB_025554 [Lonicera macranthoides]